MVNFLKLTPLLISAANAVPFKRFDNQTVSATLDSSVSDGYSATETTWVTAYTTVVLPSTTLVIPTTATSQLSILSSYMAKEGLSNVATTITTEKTIASDGITTTAPATFTSEVVASADDACVAKTVTETVYSYVTLNTDTSVSYDSVTYSTLYLTSTITTSFPVTAAFTLPDDSITTVTTYVDVTSTETKATSTPIPVSKVGVGSSSVAPLPTLGTNSTIGYNSTGF
ncbi:hypothetical protein PSN45_001025 [Yamadazyma tenuis]|uniref:uncharacterized protein n=1 Tax=Candida tenuis TaxID=2315449 RepID=UPI0027A82AA0|nr:hypothetical protein PSN45_001025 [Yamadazyma tenuis]